MTHGSLFSGIGGFDLAAEWAGFTNLFNCEWEEFPRKILKHHFPNAEQYEDIHDFDATDYNGRIDILSGGFPCQPFSVAGLRKGTEDSRHLWPEMLRVIRECQPRWVVGENVRGLVNWSDGLVFETCCTDLEAIGYSVQSFIIPACATGAPHRRDRVWLVAHAHDKGRSNGHGEIQGTNGEVPKRHDRSKSCNTNSRNASDTDILGDSSRRKSKKTKGDGSANNGISKERSKQTERVDGLLRFQQYAPATDSTSVKGERINRQGKRKPIGRSSFTIEDRWENFPTVAPICGGDDGLPKELDGITFPKWRRESIKAYGNAIVPQVAYRIFESIQDYEKRKKSPPPCEELPSHHGE